MDLQVTEACVSVKLCLDALMFQMVRWCCKKTGSDHLDPDEDLYYTEKKQAPQEFQTPEAKNPESGPVFIVSTGKVY